MLYPIQFKPLFKERIWGGDRLKCLYNKELPKNKAVGESWELVDLPDNCSLVDNGHLAGTSLRDLLENHGSELGFNRSQAAYPFGLLIKLLDAQDVLSVQVHPDENTCRLYPPARPKTECWYILSALPDSVIYRGLKPGVNRQQLLQALEQGTVEDCLQVHPVQKGDFHFLPAGTVHALGAGIVVAEVQTPSDTTYRLFDWNRRDSQGNCRELHIEQALASIHFPPDESISPPSAHDDPPASQTDALSWLDTLGPTRDLVHCDYFHVKHLALPADSFSFALDKPVVVIVLEGQGRISNSANRSTPFSYQIGQTWLLPMSDNIKITCQCPCEFLITQLGSHSE